MVAFCFPHHFQKRKRTNKMKYRKKALSKGLIYRVVCNCITSCNGSLLNSSKIECMGPGAIPCISCISFIYLLYFFAFFTLGFFFYILRCLDAPPKCSTDKARPPSHRTTRPSRTAACWWRALWWLQRRPAVGRTCPPACWLAPAPLQVSRLGEQCLV